MNSWIDELSNLKITNLTSALGLKLGRMQSLSNCPSCGRERRGNSDPRGPIGLTPNGFGFCCHRCGITGDQLDLISYVVGGAKFKELGGTGKDKVREFCGTQGWIRRTVGGVTTQHISQTHSAFKKAKQPEPPKPPKREYKGIHKWGEDLPLQYKQNLYTSDGEPVLKYLTEERKLSLEVIEQADIGCVWEDKGSRRIYWLSIPLKDEDGQIVNMKFRTIPPEKKQYRHCPDRPMPLFGCHQLDRGNETVIITEGEFDTLAMKTWGFPNVITCSSGAGSNWKDEWLDIIEQYKSFILLYDDDQAGEDGAEKLAEKLGKYRCFRSKIEGYNDPNEALMDGVTGEEIEGFLSNFKSFIDPKLSRVDEFDHELEQLILNPHTTRGDSSGSNALDNCIGGIRGRELWVITGDTGAGKSTWANWVTYEQAKKDVPVMITSFENAPIESVQQLMRMHLGGDFTKFTTQQRRQAMVDLGNMPIYIMNHYGELDREKVIETVRFSARRYGVKMALIDHLGFLTTPKSKGEDERILIENMVRDLVTVAVQDNITILLICHPNNTSVYQNRRVKITDLKGASAIRQDAHIGVVVQRKEDANPPTTILHFDKIRSKFGKNGSSCQLAFDPISCIYADTWEQTPSGRQGKSVVTPQTPPEEKRKQREQQRGR